jgi:hypothetical protein
MRYNICIVQPSQYIHSLAFIELGELLIYSLQDLGFQAQIQFNQIDPDARNILIGCHLLDTSYIQSIPKSTVILNTEQIYADSTDWSGPIFEWTKHFETWDYSERNILKFNELGVGLARYLKIGFQKELNRIHKADVQDIDILFYGSMNERRLAIINDLKAAGIKVHTAFGIYGPDRDKLISRSKIVLNHHFYQSQIFEIIRVFYLLTNSIAVVGEVNPNSSIDPMYLDGIFASPYENLTSACIQLIQDDFLRKKLENKAFETISQYPQKRFTAELLS